MAKEINEGRRNLSDQPFNAWYFNRAGKPYVNTQQVIDEIPESYRAGIDAVKLIDGLEYWFKPDIFTVVLKAGIQDISGKVDKVEGSSLVTNEKIALIHADRPDVDISGKVDKVDGSSLVTNEKIALIHADHDDTYNWKLKSIAGLVSVVPTPPSAPEILSNKSWTSYGISGAQVYREESGNYVPDLSIPVITTDVVWKNTANNLTDGVFNRCSVWSSTNARPGQIIGFGREIIVTVPKVYFVGVAADNYMSLEINSILIKQFPSGDQYGDHFQSWHLFPVFLNAGSNIIHMIGYNDTDLAAFGAEIYEATLEELQGVTTIAGLTARTIFSTKNLIGSNVEEGNLGTGYTCPDGYSLVNRAGVFSCDKIAYGEITVEKDDIVEFQRGTGSVFKASVDPLNSKRKLVDIPGSDNVFDIVLPNAGSVQDRCNGVIELPDGWSISANPNNEFDLLVSHYLNRRFAFATITAIAGSTEQLLQNNGAFSGIIAQSKSILLIQGLTTKAQPLVIHLFFS